MGRGVNVVGVVTGEFESRQGKNFCSSHKSPELPWRPNKFLPSESQKFFSWRKAAIASNWPLTVSGTDVKNGWIFICTPWYLHWMHKDHFSFKLYLYFLAVVLKLLCVTAFSNVTNIRFPYDMNVELWWNITERRKWKYWKRNLLHCHFIDHKSLITLTQDKNRNSHTDVSDQSPETCHCAQRLLNYKLIRNKEVKTLYSC